MMAGVRGLLVVVVVSLAASGATAVRGKGSVLPEVWKDIAMEYLERESWNPDCKDCGRVRQMLGKRKPEFNLSELRLEMAKQDILRKLGMTAPPTPGMISFSSLPHPIAAGTLFTKYKSDPKSKKRHTERVFAIASEISCSVDSTSVNLKLSFQMPEQARKRDQLNSAKLWLYSNEAWLTKGTAILSSKPCGALTSAQMNKMPVSLQPKDDWLEMDVTWMLQEKEECYSFKIAWSIDGGLECSTYLNTTMKPFILMDLVPAQDAADVLRDKRHVNCANGVTDCCREKLYVSFADIGWDNWIIQPKGYDAYYCKGNCANLASLSLGVTPYHSVIKKLSMKNSNMLDFSPCCTPTTLSAVQLIYVKNDSVIEKTIPNLTVESCGCM